ncbi:uncharacterized protein LOC6586465 [Drosophila mojavensis]|uniref:RRM domain-containing protein n=1 Tax=Drosophila mojavensis TaxID=7230 RepID=B4L935_DROMO|nr:uncharacterized protein LOC6586465 [Drosophila mojavensis]EDW17210.1 uncharacterized protein Dmoj_GI16630 [Drosophila mojavensis]
MDSDPQHKYRKNQVNGTLYVTTCLYLDPRRVAELETGADELFLTHIHKRTTADHIMQVAVELGPVYTLRFKVDFSGCSRGYAYLQYVDKMHKSVLMEMLQRCFRREKLRIHVRESRNRRDLLLSNVHHLTPLQVHQELRLVSHYVKLCVYEYEPKRYIYVVKYRNNDEAAMAHHKLRNKVGCFGLDACIDWLDKGQVLKDLNVQQSCCVQLSRDSDHLQASANSCRCFRI